jgi:arylformamidase
MTMSPSPAFYENEYNARAAVPDHERHLRYWAEESQKVRMAEPCYLDVAYGSEPKQNLDFFPARRGGGAAPLLVFIHGGYWRSLDKRDFSFIAPSFTRSGIAVAVINYRLIPTVPLEDVVRDCVSAMTWLYLHAGHYGANPHRMVVSGHSAGGHLAAMMLACQWPRWHGALPADVVRGALAISGLYDLEPLRHTAFLGATLALSPLRATAMSPVCLPPATHAPLMTATGGLESSEFHRQSAQLAARWSSVFLKDVPMPEHNHFTICTELASSSSALYQAARELVAL